MYCKEDSDKTIGYFPYSIPNSKRYKSNFDVSSEDMM